MNRISTLTLNEERELNGDLTGQIIRRAMKVHRTPGPVFLESILKPVLTIIVDHEIQLVNYLAATGRDVGLLINFGGRSLEFKKKFRNTRIDDISLINPIKSC